MDPRGDGLSSKPRDPAAYGLQVSLDVAHLLNELQIQRAHLVGYLMAVNLVAQLLTFHPERESDLDVEATGNGVAVCIALDNSMGRV